MIAKYFVGNLPDNCHDLQLEQIFSQFGTVVSAVVTTDPETGESKGFGIVEMDVEDVDSVIASANGLETDPGGPLNRQIRVTETK